MVCDLGTAVSESTNASDKNYPPIKAEIDGLQGAESFETFTEVVQALIFDVIAAVTKSTNSS